MLQVKLLESENSEDLERLVNSFVSASDTDQADEYFSKVVGVKVLPILSNGSLYWTATVVYEFKE